MDTYLFIIKFYYIPGKAVTLLKFGTRLSLHAQPDNLLSCPKVLCHAALYNILSWSSFHSQVYKLYVSSLYSFTYNVL